ncbi:unnamed protein product [Chrysodeixis includens]|uniref:Uncharacterized protein n=1 Tax=Chrysodeixis includens TaxID=689277 RepID=A0A9P0C2D9_CHRIL|nr:unnamed protein product [Chrysodeixis includens]
MKIMSVGLFYRGLLGKEIDLRYYGISPKGVRAMCMALANNHTVQQLDLTGNFLQDKDACYHLGQMLGDRNALQSLVLSGCRIGPTGVPPLVVYLSRQRPMQQLDLSKNDIKDLGVSYLAQAIASGAIIKQLNLSYNDLSSDSALMLAKAFGFNDCVSHLDLSWNNFTGARGPIALCRRLGHSTSLVKLDLSWTGLHLTTELRILLGAPNLKILILSNNRLTSVAAGIIAKYMHLARRLRVLDLSSNPFMPADAMLILDKMRLKQVRVRELMMDNIVVSKEFYDEMQEILALRFRKYTKITHGTVLRNYSIQLHDLRTITIKRLAYTAKENKKSKVNMMDFIMEYQKTQNSVEPGEFVKLLSSMNMQLDHDTANELMHVFPGPKNENGSKTINLGAVVEYIYRLYPDKLPPPDSSPSASPPKSPPKPKSPKGKKKKSKKGN